MRLKLLKLFSFLLLAGAGESRPQNFAPQESRPEVDGNGWKAISVGNEDVSQTVLSNSRLRTSDSQRQLKDLQYMDQSLRTVTTQLLNVTNPDEVLKTEKKQPSSDVLTKLIFVESPSKDVETQDSSTIVKTIDSPNYETNFKKYIAQERPINSKFGFLESSHPGEAMALTEEELEKELSVIRHPTHKIQPTTTGGISTWILLNPPSTTTDLPLEGEDRTKPPITEGQLIVKTTSTIQKLESLDQKKTTASVDQKKTTVSVDQKKATAFVDQKKTSSSVDQKKITASVEKVTIPPSVAFEKINTQIPKKSTPNLVKKSTTPSTPKLEKLVEKVPQQSEKLNPEKMQLKKTTVASIFEDDEASVTPKSVTTTKKVSPTTRTTIKPKTTPSNRNSTQVKNPTTKAPKPQKPKTTPQRKVTTKSDFQTSPTPKIEKVTFKPVQMISTQLDQSQVTDVPMFITKIKASVFTEMKKTTEFTTTQQSPIKEDIIETKSKNKGNHVLKVQLKRPVDDLTKIEIEPIKVNAPILKIEKIEVPKDSKSGSKTVSKNASKNVSKTDSKNASKTDLKNVSKTDLSVSNEEILSDSKIDLKFDFNPELTRINVESPERVSTTTMKTTSKRRQSNKRKKNKNRRRKPSSTTEENTALSALSTIAEALNIPDVSSAENVIQESKTEPETKIAANSTKTKKKQSQKPISTQIYNFLSREVMPSFGVMSLVGLGLGLASYFFYPFGGSIARRNYELEPNYKYNPDEYGGNYGQNEEEVISKVLQGMTKHESKFGNKEVDGKYGSKEFENKYGGNKEFDNKYEENKRGNKYPGIKEYENKHPGVKEYENNYGDESGIKENKHGGIKDYEGKHSGIKDYDNNYYKYHHYEGPFSSTPRITSTVSGPIYRPLESSYDVNYRNTEFKYPDLPTTPNYYERQKQTDFAVGKEGNVNRQFVVGNIPKEYEEKVPVASKRADFESVDGTSKFEREMAQNFNFPANSVNIPQAYTQSEQHKSEEVYEEIEITPTAVAVEHGPRLLRVRRGDFERGKRDSVIQLIPTKSEIEKEHREEEIPLSNEIFDIIDSAIPGAEEGMKEDKKKMEEGKMLEEADKKKQERDDKKKLDNKQKTEEDKTKLDGNNKKLGDKKNLEEKDSRNREDMKNPGDKGTKLMVEGMTTNLEEENDVRMKLEEENDFTKNEISHSENAGKTVESSSKYLTTKIETTKSESTTSSWRSTSARNEEVTEDWFNDGLTTEKPKQPETEGFSIFSIVKKIAEIKIKLGLTLLKHASEGFARYLGHVQKKFNGEE